MHTPEEIMDISIHLGTKKVQKPIIAKTDFRFHRRGDDLIRLFGLYQGLRFYSGRSMSSVTGVGRRFACFQSV
jgi:hypothetical protein